MGLKSKLKAKSLGVLIFSIFYAVVGVAFLTVLAVYGLDMVHVAILGILSLITAYGLFKMERWSVWLAVVLFFLGNAFSVPLVIHPFFSSAGWLPQLSLIAYLIMTWVATIYVAAKRKSFQ